MKVRKLAKLWAVFWSDTGLLYFCFRTWDEAFHAALYAAKHYERKGETLR